VARSSKPPATALPDRIARARAEGRTQQALELARQLYKQSHSPEHLDLLRQVLLERGGQLQQQNHTRDAATVYANALELDGSPEYRATLAQRLAACGDGRALRALAPDADPKMRQTVLGHLADAALRQGPSGKGLLPAEHHAGFDAALQAFAHSEAGRDDDARAALQAIGLTSPFLEWKLLVRGLLAYYAGDDARALDNWQRLDPQRVPARLAAPLRYSIDPGYARAQPAETQLALQQQAARLSSGPTGPAARLSEVRKALANTKSLATAFRLAEALLPELRRDRPELVPRLARCFFWAIIGHGQPEDVDRYYRAFPTLATVAESARLEALALEHRQMWPEAHAAWQTFARTLADGTPEWSGETGTRAQAIVWAHMGQNAIAEEREADKEMPYLFSLYYDQPEPLEPGPEECFKRSIELAPDRLEGYLALFHYHRTRGQTAKARKVGQQLLKRFPDHAETSEALGDLYLETQEPKKAREAYEKALAANPLERRLRGKLARARQNLGLELAVAKKYDAARAEYEAALALAEGGASVPLLCQWAVLEMKAGNPERAAELIARAEATPGQRLAVRYALVSESVRAQLPPAERKRIAADLKAALAVPPAPAEVLALLAAAADQRLRQLDSFRGQKTHERTFARFLDQIPIDEFGEAELEKLIGYLQAIDVRGPWKRCLQRAEVQFPDNPMFVLSWVDYYLTASDPTYEAFRMRGHLDAARRLVQNLPREAQERYLQAIRLREKKVEELGGPPVDPFQMIDPFFGFEDGPEEEDEEAW
jgi:tetratricopeptide (TPR) repeat protein